MQKRESDVAEPRVGAVRRARGRDERKRRSRKEGQQKKKRREER